MKALGSSLALAERFSFCSALHPLARDSIFPAPHGRPLPPEHSGHKECSTALRISAAQLLGLFEAFACALAAEGFLRPKCELPRAWDRVLLHKPPFPITHLNRSIANATIPLPQS